MTEKTIHDRLREIRTERFAQVGEAAEALGIAYPTYAAHENGSRGINVDAAVRYAEFFRVSLEWLITGRGSRKGKTALPEQLARALLMLEKLSENDQQVVVRTVEGLLSTYAPTSPEPMPSEDPLSAAKH